MKFRILLVAALAAASLAGGASVSTDTAQAQYASRCVMPTYTGNYAAYMRKSRAYTRCLIRELRNACRTPSYTTPTSSGSWATTPSPLPGGGYCTGASCYGAPSVSSGAPRTTYVPPYVRSDGTYVGGHWRSD